MTLRLRLHAWRSGARYEDIVRTLDPKRPISEDEHQYRFAGASWVLYWQAVRARDLGISWRQFRVGCAAWAFRADASTVEDRFCVFYGMNTKVEEKARNICAEPIAINEALGRAYTRIIGLVVVGETQPDERGVTHPTLRPCLHCRQLMEKHPLITPETVIICAQPPDSANEPEEWPQVTHEVFTFAELQKLYGK